MTLGIDVGLEEAVGKAATLDLPRQADLSQELELQKLAHDLNILKEKLKQSADTHQLRIGYANKIFRLVCGWLAFVLAGMICSGFHLWGFQLSDKVLIAFIVSTTASVIGLFAIVAKWLFPNK